MTELVLDRLARHAAEAGHRPAFTFLRESGPADRVSFGELAERVWGLAAHLRERVPAAERVVLLAPNGPDFITGLLAALAANLIAVPVYPPRRNRKAERLHAILADCRPRAVLTTAELAGTPEVAELAGRGMEVVAADRGWSAPRPPVLPADPAAVAFLQYTSGSTGTPKGVVVTHGGLAANLRQIQEAFVPRPERPDRQVSVSWLPMFHDMGLVGGVLQPLHTGSHAVFLAPEAFLRDPALWLRAVSDYRATHTGGPNFAFDHCVRHVTAEQKQQLDLSGLKVLYCGAEPIRPETLDRFAAAFAPCGLDLAALFPCYGLAEATLFVSGGPAGGGVRRQWVDGTALEAGGVTATAPAAAGGRCLVASGRVADRAAVVAVDPRTEAALPDGRVGELWVSSPGLGDGYWGQPQASREVFDNRLADRPGRFLRTGDLGFVQDGQVFVTGRVKDVIIVRGRNLYPQDIEAVVAAALPFAVANGVAAFPVAAGREERVGLVVEADRELVRAAHAGPAAAAPLVAAGRRAVSAAFDVPVQAVTFVRPGSFPRTSSGKVQRQECKARWRNGGLDVVAAWEAPPDPPSAVIPKLARHAADDTPLELQAVTAETPISVATPMPGPGEVAARLSALAQRVLNLPPGQSAPGTAPLTDWGLESVSAFTLLTKIEREFGVRIAVIDLPDPLTLDSLRVVIEQARGRGHARPAGGTIRRVSVRELVADAGRLAQVRGIVGRAFDQPGPVLDRVLGRNDGAYLGLDEADRVHSFVFYRIGQVTVAGRLHPALCVGLNCTREDVLSAGLSLRLYDRLLAAAGRGRRPVLVCGVTMNPSVLAAAELALGDFCPTAGRTPSAAIADRVRGVRGWLGLGDPTDPDPHVVRAAFHPFAYTPAEGRRLLGLIDRSPHPLLRGLRPERCDGVVFHGWLAPRPAGPTGGGPESGVGLAVGRRA